MSCCKPYYFKYPNQCNPQPVYLYYIEDGTKYIDYDGNVGNGCSPDVWHKRTLRFSVSELITKEAAEELLQDKALDDMLQEAHELTEIVYNNNCNRVRRVKDKSGKGYYQYCELLNRIERYVTEYCDGNKEIFMLDYCDETNCEYCYEEYAEHYRYVLQDLDHASPDAHIYDSCEDLEVAYHYAVQYNAYILDKENGNIGTPVLEEKQQ